MFKLILAAETPEARAFQRWVAHDVLPAIRKTGRYVDDPPRFRELVAAIHPGMAATLCDGIFEIVDE